MTLPQILEEAEKELRELVMFDLFKLGVSEIGAVHTEQKISELVKSHLILAYNQGFEKYEELKKGIDKLPRNVFKEIRDHEFIDTCDIYILLQRIKNQGLEEGKKR